MRMFIPAAVVTAATATTALLAFGGASPASAFVPPHRHCHAVTSPVGAAAAAGAAFAPPRSCVGKGGSGGGGDERLLTRTHLFRDLLKRVRGDGDGEGDRDRDEDEGGSKRETPASANKEEPASRKQMPFSAQAEAPSDGAAPAPATEDEKEEESAQMMSTEADATAAKLAVGEKPSDEEKVVNPETILAAAAATAAAATETKLVPLSSPSLAPVPGAPEKNSALEEARALRAAAEKARLEAERMDAQLTLDKISKLERELGSRKVADDAKRATDIREQLDQLRKKLSGKDSPVAAAKKMIMKKEEGAAWEGAAREKMPSTVSPLYSRDVSTGETKLDMDALVIPGTEPLSEEEIAERVGLFRKSPDFLKVLVAKTAGFDDVNTASDVNATALVLKLHKDEVEFRKNQAEVEAENSGLKVAGMTVIDAADLGEKPTFTKEQIDAKVKDLEVVPQFVKNLFPDDVAKNNTALAIKMLEDDWENEQMGKKLRQGWGGSRGEQSKDVKGQDKLKEDSSGSTLFGLGGGQDDELSEMDQMVESLFPKSTRKKDGTAPTEASMRLLMEDVLTKLKQFSPSGQPEKVSGGYIVRGVNSFENGQALIDAIDAQMARSSRAKGRALVHYVSDPTPVTEEQLMIGDRDPVLYVTGPDLRRDANRFLLAGISSVAVATAWYTALYPFLVNPDILKRAEEQLTLANAGMEYNLDWLTAAGLPLYGGFVATITAHELAHRAVAEIYGMNITLPTLIPSLVTGVTGQITALKDPPRNRQELLDFAIAGPVAGMLTSVALLFVGCGLTASMDAASYANLPALPVDVLRQSSLAGGIIESSLGSGVLSVPMSAAATSAVAEINISLHPLAIAGFFGLLVNACSLLPFGRTDGGRIALALFGRSGTQLVGLITLASLLLAGLTVSDLLLFYFSFISFFQGELEIPCRNEVDEVDFSRVLLATAGGVLVLLSLIPMV